MILLPFASTAMKPTRTLIRIFAALLLLTVGFAALVDATPTTTEHNASGETAPSAGSQNGSRDSLGSVQTHVPANSSSFEGSPWFAAFRNDTRRRGTLEHLSPNYPFCLHFFFADFNGPSVYTCLDVEQSRQNWQSADAQLWKCLHNPRAQKLEVRFHSRQLNTYWYTISADQGRYCLDVPGGNAFSGQRVRWWQCNGSTAQLWDPWIIDVGTGFWDAKKFLSPFGHSNSLCLDAMGGYNNRRFGQEVGLYHCHKGPEQDLKSFNWDKEAFLCGG